MINLRSSKLFLKIDILGRWYGVLMEAVLPTEEMSLARDMAVPIDCGANLADILNNALPPDKRSHDKDKPLSDSSVSLDVFFLFFSFFLFKKIFFLIFILFIDLQISQERIYLIKLIAFCFVMDSFTLNIKDSQCTCLILKITVISRLNCRMEAVKSQNPLAPVV